MGCLVAMMSETPYADRDLRSFGRKRGRKLSARQRRLLAEVLPKFAIDPGRLGGGALAEKAQSVWLEIGFGGGEHLLWQAEHNPNVSIIGCEPFEDGVVKALTAIEDKALTNIRVYPNDARQLLRLIPDNSLSRVFILFPDPWPKKRHVKRRLVSSATLDLLARVMKPGAELRVATDVGDYARTLLLAAIGDPRFCWLVTSPEDWRVRPDDWPRTRYEAKALREGRMPYFFRFQRR